MDESIVSITGLIAQASQKIAREGAASIREMVQHEVAQVRSEVQRIREGMQKSMEPNTAMLSNIKSIIFEMQEKRPSNDRV